VNHPALSGLYPFLDGSREKLSEPAVEGRSPRSNDGLLAESVRQKSDESREASRAFFEHNTAALIAVARSIARVFEAGGKLLCMGNGGSSCDAAHFSVEFLHPVTTGRPALPVLNLAMDTAMMSAVGNDLGMRHVFRRQLEAHARPGDALVGFSTSGNAENLLAAYQKAKQLGLLTIGFCGGSGGQMKASGLCDHCLVVETDSIHRVQEVHVAAYHVLWDLTHTLLGERRATNAGGELDP
jgi:D-sedoheptulose 7-phosphate isomerase